MALDLPPLPFTAKAIEIALNGMTMGLLMPFVGLAFKRFRMWIDFITLMVFAVAMGMFMSNLWLYIFITSGVSR